MKYMLFALLFISCRPSMNGIIKDRVAEFKKHHPECAITIGNKDGKPYLFVIIKGKTFSSPILEGNTAIFYAELIEKEILQQYSNAYGYSIDFPDNKAANP